MKVKLLVSRSGADFSQNAGEVIEVDDAEALRMVQADQAVVVEERETATKKQTVRKAAK